MSNLPGNLPETLQEPLRQALRQLGDTSEVRSLQPVSGGCINNAQYLETGQNKYLLKWNRNSPVGMFESEADGLKLLAETHTVRVPDVYVVQAAQADQPAFILLEWLEGPRNVDDSQLGEQLAQLHRKGHSPEQPPAYGLDENNYLGSTRQINQWETDWVTFFINCRLKPQITLAEHNHRLTPNRQRHLERLIERLPGLLSGVERRPALIHGDLWGGNVIPGPTGPALIDPAVSYSDREAEIAYTQLFGGFSQRFYAAYNRSWPLDPGFVERSDLYNLYHLLNHLNLFGERYGGQVDTVLGRYTK